MWTSRHWGSWHTSPRHVGRRGKADVRGVISPLTHGPCEHSRPDMKKLRKYCISKELWYYVTCCLKEAAAAVEAVGVLAHLSLPRSQEGEGWRHLSWYACLMRELSTDQALAPPHPRPPCSSNSRPAWDRTNWYFWNIFLEICSLCIATAHTTSKPCSSACFDDVPIEAVEKVPVVVKDLP